MKFKISLIFALFVVFTVFAQEKDLQAYEKDLQISFQKLQISTSEEDVKKCNLEIENYLKQALALKESYFYPFDSLAFLGKIYSEDKKIRIYTWNAPFLNGTHAYGCIVQQKDNGQISSFSVKDKAYKPPLTKNISLDNWYGSLYYKAIPMKMKKKKRKEISEAYVLLGWAGYNDLTTLKVIDVLSFKGGNVHLGDAMFKVENKIQNRVVFEYSAQYRMTLDYDEKTKQIIFDHLAPSSPKYEGIYSDYGPDFTYDSFFLKGNEWIFKEDVDARNR